MAKAMKCKNCGSPLKNGKCAKCDAAKGKGKGGKGGKMPMGKGYAKPKTGWNDHDYSD